MKIQTRGPGDDEEVYYIGHSAAWIQERFLSLCLLKIELEVFLVTLLLNREVEL